MRRPRSARSPAWTWSASRSEGRPARRSTPPADAWTEATPGRGRDGPRVSPLPTSFLRHSRLPTPEHRSENRGEWLAPRRGSRDSGGSNRHGRSPPASANAFIAEVPMSCRHLSRIEPAPARTPGCEECLKTGSGWVHLRLCLSCGHVGCCDSSPGRHATRTSTTRATRWSPPTSPASGGPGATSIGRNCPCPPRPSRICGSGLSRSSPCDSREARRA